MKFARITVCVMSTLLIWCCNHNDHKGHEEHEGHTHKHELEHEHEVGTSHHHEDGEELHEGEISFTRSQARMAGIEIETLSPVPFGSVIRTFGQIMSVPGHELTVVATASGLVHFASGGVATGQSVKRGECLALVTARDMQDGDPVALAAANLATLQREYERAGKLVKEKIISGREFEEISLQYESARMAYQGVAVNHTDNGVKVVSALNGYVKEVYAGEGEYVTAGTPLALVSNADRMQLVAQLPQHYFGHASEITSANLKLSYEDTVRSLANMEGKLLAYGKTAAAGYIPMTFEFTPDSEIVGGTQAEVYLLSEKRDSVIAIPVTALIEEEEAYYVVVQLEDEIYRKVDIQTGRHDGERVEVVSGLKSGDRIVAKGAYRVKSASVAVIPGHTHNH